MAASGYKSSNLKKTGLYPEPENDTQQAQEPAVSPREATGGGVGPKEAQKPAQASQKPEKKRRTQTTIYHNDDELQRAEAAFAFTMGHTGHRSWTKFVEHAINKYTLDLEQQYNDSKPFGS